MLALAVPGAAWAADESGDEFAAEIAGAAEAVDEPDAPRPAVMLARPVGRVRLAQVGDDLGARRFEARSNRLTAATITFSERPYRASTAFTGPASLPTGMPLAQLRLTSQFGYRLHPMSRRYQAHHGVDLAAPMGSPVMATADGAVSIAGWMGGYGLVIQIDHGGEVETRYAHLSRLAVAPGEIVKRGQIIGFVGSTGRSTGPHLHYEVRRSNVAVNPLSLSAR